MDKHKTSYFFFIAYPIIFGLALLLLSCLKADAPNWLAAVSCIFLMVLMKAVYLLLNSERVKKAALFHLMAFIVYTVIFMLAAKFLSDEPFAAQRTLRPIFLLSLVMYGLVSFLSFVLIGISSFTKKV